MNKKESLELYTQGVDAWNSWAEEMLAQRESLIETGKWMSEAVSPEETSAWERVVELDVIGSNRPTQDWLEAAKTDFCSHVFHRGTDFTNFKFPSVADFRSTVFKDRVLFEKARFMGHTRFDGASFKSDVQFRQATFTTNAWFERASFNEGAHFPVVTFSSNVAFDNATFAGVAHFSRVAFAADVWFEGALFEDKALFTQSRFNGDARFKGASFNGDAHFRESLFKGTAKFEQAKFNCLAWFDGASFTSDADFNAVVFGGRGWFTKATFASGAWFHEATFINDARFHHAIFEDYAFFYRTIFKKESLFCGIKGQGLFSFEDATFYSVPDFSQAHFSEAPQLDDIHWLRGSQSPNVNDELPGRWRALKRLAIQAHDHERELVFLAEEIKSLRGVEDWLLPNPLSFRKGEPICWPGGGRYWAGLFYQWFSDFGRSTWRPFLCWLVVTILSALFYFHYSAALNLSNSSETTLAIAAPICDPPIDALYLAVHHGLVISGLGHAEKLPQSYACLYGNSGKYQLVPIMPTMVVFVGIAQTILSAVLIFLFLLALRNYFRIK